MFTNMRWFSKLLLLFFIAGFISCHQKETKPGFRHGKEWVEHHFTADRYLGLVEVVDVKMVDVKEDNYMGGVFLNMKLNATIDVKKDYVISRMYVYNGLEVDEAWPENFEAQMAVAQTEEERERIRSNFENYTFSKGQHDITVYVEYSYIDDRWVVFSSSIDGFGHFFEDVDEQAGGPLIFPQ
jgi:hypothetical protein